MEDRPWPEWKNDKLLTQRQLARILKPFGIVPKKIRDGVGTLQGYKLEDLQDSFRRYLPPDPEQAEQASNHADSCTSENRNKEACVPDSESVEKWRRTSTVPDVPDPKGITALEVLEI